MNNIQRTVFFFLISSFLILTGCQDPFIAHNAANLPADKGSFSLTLSQSRTILPAAPSLSAFAVYNLAFTQTNGGSAVNTDRTNSTLSTEQILLEPGTYNLTVKAYKDSGKSQLMARGTADGIVITARQNTARAVTLEALLTGGTGTFSWNITVPQDVTAASMVITPANVGGTAQQTVTLHPNDYAGSRTLNSGQYNLTINLESPSGRVVWKELLYVYQNLDSSFTFTFTNAYFSGVYTVTYDSNGGTNVGQQSVLYGGTVSAPTDPINAGFYVEGWYKEQALTNKWNFATDTVTSDITLYAKWDPVFYTVTFDLNGGYGWIPRPITVQAGLSIIIPDGDGMYPPPRRNSIFSRWNTNYYGTGTSYNAGESFTPTGNITLYAIWNVVPPKIYSESVIEVIFNDNTATVTLENLNGHDIFLVKVNKSDLLVNAAATGSVHASSASFQNANKNLLSSGEELLRMGHPAAEKFNANPPPIVEKPLSRQWAVFASFAVNDSKNFWVETSVNSGSFVSRTATLMAVGTYSNIWVMNENIGSGTSQNKITSEQALTLAQKFDEIYPLETNLLGYEYGGGPGGNGGRDGDPKVQILIYDIGSNVAGYFWGKDFYDDSQLSAGQKSNLAEIFYIDANQLINFPVYIHSALIHEFQHMINFNQKTVKHDESSSTWYNEMLSMMTEDIIAPLIGINPTDSYHAIRTRMPLALGTYYIFGTTEWSAINSSMSYATKFAFGAYLMRNYGGAELLQRILANNSTDVDSITSALNEFSSGLTFEHALKRYGEAMVFSGSHSEMPEGVLSFDKTVTKTINGTAYTAYGFDVWNNFGTTTPAVLNFNQREMMPHSISVHSTNDWKKRKGNLSITLDRPSDPDVVLYLMVTWYFTYAD